MVAGLGNPGPKYQKNRHNAGFLVLDAFAASLDGTGGSGGTKRGATVMKGELPDDVEVVCVWPGQFMNLSGGSVCPLMKDYGIAIENLLVIHDEIELPFGEIRLKKGGGHKGHNGLRDIIQRCGSSDFTRLRFGVGRPDHPDVAGYVLSDFAVQERDRFSELFERAIGMIREWIRTG